MKSRTWGILAGFLVIMFTAGQVQDSHVPEVSASMVAEIVPVPEGPSFAGEAVPMYDEEVVERLSREMQVNTYWHSNTLLLLQRSTRYFPIIEPILKEEGIPDDFKYLAVAESGLNHVVSPVGATGMWQIMKTTGREQGLEINSEVDERYHVEKATRAACQYLKSAYDKFGSWTLAAASYNMGISGLEKQLKRQKETKYYDLALNSETSRYIFRVLALKQILGNPGKYGFHLKSSDTWGPFEERWVKVHTPVLNWGDFAHQQGVSYKTLKRHNPWLRGASLTNEDAKTYYVAIPLNANPEEEITTDE